MLWRNQTPENESLNASLRVYSVINSEYMQLGLAWGKRVREVGGINPIFVCSDAESVEFLTAHEFPCTFKPPKIPLSATETRRWKGGNNFASDKAIYTNILKFVAAAEFLNSGHPVLYSDVDAIWIRNPIPYLLRQNADFVYQPAHARKRTSHGWGIEACAGFFHFRPSFQAQKLVEKLIFILFYRNRSCINFKFPALSFFHDLKIFSNRLKWRYFGVRPAFLPTKDGCDQDLLNAILRRTYEVEWPIEPSNWEHCSLEGGWVEPVRGICRKTRLNLVALPHAYFQRQGTTAEEIEHAVVCHPIAGQSQAQKLDKFMSLGIDLANSRFPNLLNSNANIMSIRDNGVD